MSTLTALERRAIALQHRLDRVRIAIAVIKEEEYKVKRRASGNGHAHTHSDGSILAVAAEAIEAATPASNGYAGGRQPAGSRTIDLVMAEIAKAGGPLSVQDLKTRLPHLPTKVVGAALSTGKRWGRIRWYDTGWILTAKGRKEVRTYEALPA